MIVVDTSALVAVVLGEPESDACIGVLARADPIVISAVTAAEALIVAARRGVGDEMRQLLDGLGAEIAPVAPAAARRVADSYARWGKGAHPAGLNFGDCFSYDLASERSCPLLFVGQDFAKTDIRSALASRRKAKRG